jgi:hypothetical protein
MPDVERESEGDVAEALAEKRGRRSSPFPPSRGVSIVAVMPMMVAVEDKRRGEQEPRDAMMAMAAVTPMSVTVPPPVTIMTPATAHLYEVAIHLCDGGRDRCSSLTYRRGRGGRGGKRKSGTSDDCQRRAFHPTHCSTLCA